MNNNPMNEILQELRKPFHPTHITWKPGMIGKDQGKALALAYADLRAYQNRLDEICGMDWSVTYTPWGDRIVCHLTIQGITRSSSGEPDSQSERSEIAGTSAEAQSFKRACAMFGLGRYLYNLPSVWVEYDPATRHFTDKAKAKLEGIIVQHYRRTVTDEVEQSQPSTIQRREMPEEAPKPEVPVQASLESHPENEEVAQPADEATFDATPDPLREQFNQLGESLYGEQWAQVSRHNVERITGGKAVETGALTTDQIQKLVDGMKKLQRKRNTAPVIQQNAHAFA